ncbi:hypothetical protein BO83DRAFT_432794 [Aspergillus eucalypticola CBS 122712]|uniref:Uncharacterized protein n=1 Tax=Aspergillus eucalypticola (strain CBS 122712 / IBT 29274) TaxID=1448314 RepID=A0A317UN04_ASPEC|nr:uncharacterized protein BO83DRAFT_432794 [Aspergillus eucalypticola CBS 122712]PWY61947.1 hypothetical protein BO83DRAFT_432794 [Aspergillus eucalypticola CBS 122712]
MALAKPGDLRGSAVPHDIVSTPVSRFTVQGCDQHIKPLSSIVWDKRWKILVAFKYLRIPYHELAVLDRKHAADPRVKIIAMKNAKLSFSASVGSDPGRHIRYSPAGAP